MNEKMSWRRIALLAATCVVGAATVALAQQAPAQPEIPTVTLGPGLRPVPDYRTLAIEPPAPQVPEGFTPLFNGRDLTGWHVSPTARHGVTPDFRVTQGVIVGTQNPIGGGGLLLSDETYGNFEFYMEVKPDWGNDSGFLFRTTDEGVAYQVTLDYLEGGSMGRLIGEGGIQGTVAAQPTGDAPEARTLPDGSREDPGMAAWTRDDWNTVRIRVQGDVPRATVWINDTLVSDAVDTANHAVGGIVEGRIALQIHGGTARWQPGGFWRWRNIGIRKLD